MTTHFLSFLTEPIEFSFENLSKVYVFFVIIFVLLRDSTRKEGNNDTMASEHDLHESR